MSDRFSYHAHGLAVVSEIALPELLPREGADRADLRIAFDPSAGDAAARHGGGRAGFDFVAIGPGDAVMAVGDLGAIRVRDGARVGVSLRPGADPDLLRLFLIGSAIGMALHQRGLLVLHAATVVGPDGARAIVGPQGAGKSTLAAALGRRGFAVFGDDVIAVRQQGEVATVAPASGVFKVTPRTLAALALSPEGLRPVGGPVDKLYLPNRIAGGEAADLREVVVIGTDPAAEPALRPLTGFEALTALATHTYRPHYVDLLDRRAAHFCQIAALAGGVPVRALSRPWGLDGLDETAGLLDRVWRTG